MAMNFGHTGLFVNVRTLADKRIVYHYSNSIVISGHIFFFYLLI